MFSKELNVTTIYFQFHPPIFCAIVCIYLSSACALNQTTLLFLYKMSLTFRAIKNYLCGGWLGKGIFSTFLLHLQLYVLSVHLCLRKNLSFLWKTAVACYSVLPSLVGVEAGRRGRRVSVVLVQPKT